MKRILPIIFAIVLVASACNGHGADAKDQSFSRSGWSMDHNHDFSTGAARASTEFVRTSGVATLEAKVCVIAVKTRNSDNAQVGDPLLGCTGFVSVNPNGYTVSAAASIDYNPATETVHAFESSVEFKINGGAIVKCEYHDPDASNPAFCPGRDAAGN